ncbi:MAG TPA: SRPBCC domain-containing protein [Acidimicrobiia bacterium]|nr:SRPBCC domain-containing protein [Acidimicrobiia bacterium]
MSDPIVIERLIAAPPSVVYSYLTSSEKWARWQGVDAIVEPESGGEFAVSMPNGTSARGEFVELEPDRRVVFTWGWADHPDVPPGSTTVEIDLIGEDGGTRLRLTHRGLPPDEVPIHTAGWEHYTIRLGDVAEGREPGPDIPAS